MFQGSGRDGSATAIAGGDRIAAALLRAGGAADPSLPDCTETAHTSLWRPAPGAVVVLPERYTPTYAYPLLVWLAPAGEDELSARAWLEEISTRNFVAIGLRPELYAGAGGVAATLSANSPSGGLSRFESLLQCVNNWVRLHPERRYIAGAGEASLAAIAWLLARPDRFAGGIAIDVPGSSTSAWRAQHPLIQQRRLLWVRNPERPAGDDEAQRVALQCLGLKVTAGPEHGSGSRSRLADAINRWVLSSVPTTIGD